ncbi:hypothetical protein ACFSW8_08710 [Rubritalea tangerina]|uniref:Methionyl-tRNA formyltransferase-like C-terminal domain-containing protein n=2 Tax=Rubritalea tangerina TaxID=430798 RepID=A0ABW4ZAV0_9BACT
MTDVPYGRGGSPLQNLIVRGHRDTMMTALRMTNELDAGPVYMKRHLSLEGGSAEEIYIRAGMLSMEMVVSLVNDEPDPVVQEGEVTHFVRRTPQQSELPVEDMSLESVFDFIRMLDADGYPRAFKTIGGLKLEFSRSALREGKVEASVAISIDGENDNAND